MISAKIIADSLSPSKTRLTTFVLTFPRIVLAEFNTHRMISKNSASSRAIPFHKMLSMVQENPFIPLKWIKEHKGMQGFEYFNEEESKYLETNWLHARNDAVENAISLSDAGVTKQICNRLLEPFMYHTVIATGTDWENLFALRAHSQAEIHIQELAYKMLEVYNLAVPKLLEEGQWHIPFGEKIDFERLLSLSNSFPGPQDPEILKVKIATARCARVSYLNFEGRDDYGSDLKLHDTLKESGHFSPFEHCAMASANYHSNGNFAPGWVQYRKTLQGENKKDLRVTSKT